MKWLALVATDKRREYVNAERIVKVVFLADGEGKEKATIYVAGSGDQLVGAGQVSDPESLQSLRIMVGELPRYIPQSAAGQPRPM